MNMDEYSTIEWLVEDIEDAESRLKKPKITLGKQDKAWQTHSGNC